MIGIVPRLSVIISALLLRFVWRAATRVYSAVGHEISAFTVGIFSSQYCWRGCLQDQLFVQFFQSLLSLAVSLSGLGIMFSYTDTVGGWRSDEILALVGIYFFVVG